MIQAMNLLLLEDHADSAQHLLGALRHGLQRVTRIGELSVATGSFAPHDESAAAILMGFDLPTTNKLRVLKRLWAWDCAMPSFLAIRPGSAGDELLCKVEGRCTIPTWTGIQTRPGAAWRLRLLPLRALPLERLMALERVMQRQAQRLCAGAA